MNHNRCWETTGVLMAPGTCQWLRKGGIGPGGKQSVHLPRTRNAASLSHINYKPAPLVFLLSQPDGSFPIFPILGFCEREFVLFCKSAYLASKPPPPTPPLPSHRHHNNKHHQKRLILPDLDSISQRFPKIAMLLQN